MRGGTLGKSSLTVLCFCAVGVVGCGRPTIVLTTDAEYDPLGVQVAPAEHIEEFRDEHSDSSPFRDGYDSPESYNAWVEDDDGGGRYSRLHLRLHERVEMAFSKYFHGMPIPSGYDSSFRDASAVDKRYYCYSYQNYDWFDCSRQITVLVLADQISRELIAALQGTLKAEHNDWAIVLAGCPDRDYASKYQLLITRDAVFVPTTFVADFR